MALFSSGDREKLSGPHIARAWFGVFDLPSGTARLHNGVGTVNLGGYDWKGVTDPMGGTMVFVEQVEDPRFGVAASTKITLSGVNVAFWQSVKADARELEGRTATLYWAMVDPETQEVGLFKPLLPGRMSAPSLHRQGIGIRYVTLTVEGLWQSRNYPFGGRWSFADQLRRYPGDKGGQYIGQEVSEVWK